MEVETLIPQKIKIIRKSCRISNNLYPCVRGGQFETLLLPSVTFVSESPKDDTVQREAFTKEWKFGSDLSGYSVEVLSSDFSSYGTVSISGNTVSMDLTPAILIMEIF